uniref:Uncharacterized protein n=1 Tax=viral metagenome TaxID=1070528 RepID=A0A6C0HIQ7_9ZZZZ
MPSSLNLFIRTPKGVSEHEIRDAVIRKDICSVIGVVIKKGKSNNSAVVMIDYWYKGTRHIRDALIRGESITISSSHNNIWLAYEYKPNTTSKSEPPAPTKVKAATPRNVDEFGRDTTRKSKPVAQPALNAKAPAFIPIAPTLNIAAALPIAPALGHVLPPFVTDTRAERRRNRNNYAAEEFIQQYEYCGATPAKIPETAIAPGAPEKYKQELGEICGLSDVIRQLEGAFISEQTSMEPESDSISDVTDDFVEEHSNKKVRFITIDVDAPKQSVLEVDYSTMVPVKKRNIRYVKK